MFLVAFKIGPSMFFGSHDAALPSILHHMKNPGPRASVIWGWNTPNQGENVIALEPKHLTCSKTWDNYG